MKGKCNARGKQIIIRINGEYYECFIKFKGKNGGVFVARKVREKAVEKATKSPFPILWSNS